MKSKPQSAHHHESKQTSHRLTVPSLIRHSVWLGFMLCLAEPTARGSELVLYDFDQLGDAKTFHCNNAKAELARSGNHSVLQIETGHAQSWPGVTLPAGDGHLDLSPYATLQVQVKNTGARTVTVSCRVDDPAGNGKKNCASGSLTLGPGQTNALIVHLPHESRSTLDGKLFGMVGYPAGPREPDTLNLKEVKRIMFFVSRPTEDYRFEVSDIKAVGEHTPPTAWVTDGPPFFPFIDSFGQYRHKDWPGKVHSVDDLQERRKTEAAELKTHSGPAGWDQYGGWSGGPKLKASGFFRTQKVRGKWWLVDPDGHLFWSHGIDCVRNSGETPIDERATWFEDFPGDHPEFREFFSSGNAIKEHFAGRKVKTFSFAGLNAKRKYGEHWRQEYGETAQLRIRSWGLNTIGNWSESGIYLLRHTPYTDTLGTHGAKMIAGSKGYWGQFPDVFDASFSAVLRKGMEAKTNSSANDPWCIGYFCDNEMSWDNDTTLALAALQSPPEQAAKRELMNDLKAKYTDIARLNSAWGSSYVSWEALQESNIAPDKLKAHEDLTAFGVRLAETYFRTVRDSIKAVAPRQLYLGCRFGYSMNMVNAGVTRAAGKYCDVVSYNIYQTSIADFVFPGEDKPLIVGEFHFGALDRGLFHTGLVPMEDQSARAEAYRHFVLSALQHPQFVGTHWFQWQDESTTGRALDGENFQIGFLDVADTPYAETVAASRDMGEHLYVARLKK